MNKIQRWLADYYRLLLFLLLLIIIIIINYDNLFYKHVINETKADTYHPPALPVIIFCNIVLMGWVT